MISITGRLWFSPQKHIISCLQPSAKCRSKKCTTYVNNHCWKLDLSKEEKVMSGLFLWRRKSHISTLILFEISCSKSIEIFIHFSTSTDRKHEMIFCILEPKKNEQKRENYEGKHKTVGWRRGFCDGESFPDDHGWRYLEFFCVYNSTVYGLPVSPYKSRDSWCYRFISSTFIHYPVLSLAKSSLWRWEETNFWFTSVPHSVLEKEGTG